MVNILKRTQGTFKTAKFQIIITHELVLFLEMFHLKRVKPFALLVSLNLLILLPLFIVLLSNYENKVARRSNLLHLNPYRNDEFDTDANKHLSLLREAFKDTISHYETSRTFGEKFAVAVKSPSSKNVQLTGKISKQYLHCSNKLFLLIQIHSIPESFMSRQAIRMSWGSMDHFIIGNSQKINATLR